MTIYAAEVREAVAGSVDAEKLAEAWRALHPADVSKAVPAALAAFLGRARTAISDALKPVLARLATEAWVLGNRSALAAVDSLADVDWGGWKPGDYAAAEQIAGPGLRQLLGEQHIRIKSIAESRLEELSLVLEDTLRSDEIRRQPGTEPLPPFLSVGDLAGRLKSVLDNPDRAELVAQAEIARAQASAARQVYAETGRTEVEVSTAEDDKVCPVCDAAQKLGAHPLGAPPLVPLHPRCRCAELPVLAAKSLAKWHYDPAQPRDEHGKWLGGPGHLRITSAKGWLQTAVTPEHRRELKAAAAKAGKAMTPAQRKTVEQWTSVKGMVRRIQTGKASAKTAEAFDQAMHEAPKVDGLVYRGVKADSKLAQLAGRLRPGSTVRLDEPVSTSIDPAQAASFGTFMFEIDSPAAAYIAGIGKLYEYEQEAVLAAGSFRVVSIETVKMNFAPHGTHPVRVVKLQDVTSGERTWQHVQAASLKAAGAAGDEDEDEDRSDRFVQGDGPGEFKLVEDS